MKYTRSSQMRFSHPNSKIPLYYYKTFHPIEEIYDIQKVDIGPKLWSKLPITLREKKQCKTLKMQKHWKYFKEHQ